MWKLLLVLGTLFLLGAGGAYLDTEGKAAKRRGSAAETDRVLTGLNRSLHQWGENDLTNYDSASKIQVDHTLTWFLVGAGTLSIIIGLAVAGNTKPNQSKTA